MKGWPSLVYGTALLARSGFDPAGSSNLPPFAKPL